MARGEGVVPVAGFKEAGALAEEDEAVGAAVVAAAAANVGAAADRVDGSSAGGVASRVGVDGSGRPGMLVLAPPNALAPPGVLVPSDVLALSDAPAPSDASSVDRVRYSVGIHPAVLFGSRIHTQVQP
jgi:hypothetical protein